MLEILDGIKQVIVETDEEKPTIIAEITNDKIDVADGYRVRMKPEDKMKVMISQPMNGKTDEEIEEVRDRAIKYLESNGYEVVNSLFTDQWYSDESMKDRGVVNIPVCFLAKSLDVMSMCNAVYFCKGWHTARGCCIEHEIAEKYGLELMYE